MFCSVLLKSEKVIRGNSVSILNNREPSERFLGIRENQGVLLQLKRKCGIKTLLVPRFVPLQINQMLLLEHPVNSV